GSIDVDESGKRNGRRRSSGRKRSNGRAALLTDREVAPRPVRDRSRRSNRNRKLRQLLDGLRALDAGDFTMRLSANGDPLMAEVVEVFNSVASRQKQFC